MRGLHVAHLCPGRVCFWVASLPRKTIQLMIQLANCKKMMSYARMKWSTDLKYLQFRCLGVGLAWRELLRRAVPKILWHLWYGWSVLLPFVAITFWAVLHVKTSLSIYAKYRLYISSWGTDTRAFLFREERYTKSFETSIAEANKSLLSRILSVVSRTISSIICSNEH